MSQDILGRALANYGGSFSVDDASLTFPNLAGAAAFVPSIVMNLGLQYQQAISRFYGLNRNQVFLVAGRTQGNANLQQILAPGGSLKQFYETYGNVCKAKENVIQFSLRTGCGTNGESRVQTILKAGMCVLQQTSFNSDSETATISNALGMSFESLEYDEQ